jgi:hypothetical protein
MLRLKEEGLLSSSKVTDTTKFATGKTVPSIGDVQETDNVQEEQ